MSISVIIPCYRAAATLRRAVDSALTGAPADLEVLLVDDGSPDDTGASVTNWQPLTLASGRCIAKMAARVRPAIPGWTPRTGTGCCFWMPTMRFYPVCGPRWTP